MESGIKLQVCSLIILAVICAAGERVQAQWHYYYNDERRPLQLDPFSLAVFQSSRLRGIASSPPNLKTFGIVEDDVHAWPISGWYLLKPPAAQRGIHEQIPMLISQLETSTQIDFVSPVFTGDDGGPVIITPYIHLRFDESVSHKEAEATLTAWGAGEIIDRNWGNMSGAYRIRSLARNGTDVLDAANELALRPEVSFAVPDMIFTGRGSLIPNDSFFNDCWGLHNTGQFGGAIDVDMDAPEAWDTTTGDPSIIVVIIDTGVQQNHPDINQIGGTDTTSDASTNGDPVNGFDNHGTAVAGCVSAIINNSIGTVGIAPDCKSASARTFISINSSGNWTSSASWTVNSLVWAESIGARVTNNSNFYGFQDPSINNKYDELKQAGMVHFGSAGNDNLISITYPASLTSVNAVAAIGPDGNLTSFSNRGPGLAFSAPGISVMTTDRTGTAGWVNGDYVFANGTSFASPYTAGVAALILSMDPSLSALEVEARMQQTAVDAGALGYDTTFGWGHINAEGAVNFVSILPPVAAIDPFGFPKDRYITLNTATNGITPFAIRVTVPGGGFKYVGNVMDLGSAGFYAELVDAPEFRPWPETVLHVRGCEFAPGNSYTVESTENDVDFSTPFIAVTTDVPAPREFGDVVGSFNGVDWAAPDGIVTTNDIVSAVLTFQLDPIAPHKARVDLVPKIANTIIASDDILATVRGFEGDPYFFGTDCTTGTCVPSCP